MFSPYFNCYCLHPVLIYSELFWRLIVPAEQITQCGLSLVKSIYWFIHYYLVFVAHWHGTHATVKGIFPSLGAHSACQLSTADIRKTWEWATNTFHRVQQSTILVGIATRNILRILVNTDEITWMLVSMIFCHQVPMILLGPSRWTIIPGRHHQHRATWLDEADNAYCFMIMDISLKRVTAVLTHFIFSTVNVSGGLIAIFVLVILWIVWKAKVVRSTTRVIVEVSTHYTWYNQGKAFIDNYSL